MDPYLKHTTKHTLRIQCVLKKYILLFSELLGFKMIVYGHYFYKKVQEGCI